MTDEVAPVTEATEEAAPAAEVEAVEAPVHQGVDHAHGERGHGAAARRLSHIEAREGKDWAAGTTAAQVG